MSTDNNGEILKAYSKIIISKGMISMNPLKQIKAPCAKCPYKLGLVKTLVNPCPECRLNDYQSYKQFMKYNFDKKALSKKE